MDNADLGITIEYRLSRKAQKQDPTDLLGYESCNGSCGFMAIACGFQCKSRLKKGPYRGLKIPQGLSRLSSGPEFASCTSLRGVSAPTVHNHSVAVAAFWHETKGRSVTVKSI